MTGVEQSLLAELSALVERPGFLLVRRRPCPSGGAFGLFDPHPYARTRVCDTLPRMSYDHLRASLGLSEAEIERAPNVVKKHFLSAASLAKAAATTTEKKAVYDNVGRVLRALVLICKKIDAPLYQPLKKLADRWEEV